MVLWGLCVRAAALYHATWFVNSAAHVWGSKPFEDSVGKNNWWVALLAMGEGWHNNHHAFPKSARHGIRWFEFDATWMMISFFEKIGLATDVIRPTPSLSPEEIAAAKAAKAARAVKEAVAAPVSAATAESAELVNVPTEAVEAVKEKELVEI